MLDAINNCDSCAQHLTARRKAQTTRARAGACHRGGVCQVRTGGAARDTSAVRRRAQCDGVRPVRAVRTRTARRQRAATRQWSADRARVLGWRRRRRRRRRAVHTLCSGELRRRRRAVPCADLLRAAGRARIRALASASTRTSTHQKIENPICVCYLYASCLVAHKVWRRKSIALSIGRGHLLCQ